MRCVASFLCVLLVACGDDEGDVPSADHPNVSCADFDAARCVEIAGADTASLLDETNALSDDTVVILGVGTYELDNSVTLRNASGITLVGQGALETTLDFAQVPTQANGVDVVGDRFEIRDLTILDAKKDGLRIEDSDEVTIRRVVATWSGGALETNGAYGIYPVGCTNVLVEDSEASFASDAGLYVGQCAHVIVRNNLVHDNVAGLEIENTQFADVYENTAENNTGGLVVFDLPGNPIVGRDVHIHDNTIRENNHTNFAPGGTVAQIPPGTGTFAMASRRVVIEDNTYVDNDTVDIAVISGLVVAGNEDDWALDSSSLNGEWEDLALVADGDMVFNYRSENVVIRNNSHTGGGTDAGRDGINGPELGALLLSVYGDISVDNLLYDAIGESMFSPTNPSENSNDNHICMGADEGSFASLDLENLGPRVQRGDFLTAEDLYRPTDTRAPFDCDALNGGSLSEVSLPQLP